MSDIFNSDLPVIDLTNGIDPVYTSDPPFYTALVQRQTDMISFMNTIKVKKMTTQITNATTDQIFKVLITLP